MNSGPQETSKLNASLGHTQDKQQRRFWAHPECETFVGVYVYVQEFVASSPKMKHKQMLLGHQ